MKKIFVGLLTLGAVLVVIPMFAAFEAHVINVTAKIENALSVSDAALDFGTVFPQEHLDKRLTVALSDSFVAANRAQSVDYFIRQKPKCGLTTDGGKNLIDGSTKTGHVVVGDNTATPEVEPYWIDCGSRPENSPDGSVWGVLPSLCEYISKEGEDENDDKLASFHTPWTIDGSSIIWNDVNGRLEKTNDVSDNWTIDLAVPCFGGYCAQDWADFVHEINPAADPSAYTQPIDNEHKVFGCDLWVEVNDVNDSRPSDID